MPALQQVDMHVWQSSRMWLICRAEPGDLEKPRPSTGTSQFSPAVAAQAVQAICSRRRVSDELWTGQTALASGAEALERGGNGWCLASMAVANMATQHN